jgi:hypothetical protein
MPSLEVHYHCVATSFCQVSRARLFKVLRRGGGICRDAQPLAEYIAEIGTSERFAGRTRAPIESPSPSLVFGHAICPARNDHTQRSTTDEISAITRLFPNPRSASLVDWNARSVQKHASETAASGNTPPVAGLLEQAEGALLILRDAFASCFEYLAEPDACQQIVPVAACLK